MRVHVLLSSTLSQTLDLKKFRNCTSTVTSVVNIGGRSVWLTGDGRRSPVCPPLYITQWAWGSASIGCIRGSWDLSDLEYYGQKWGGTAVTGHTACRRLGVTKFLICFESIVLTWSLRPRVRAILVAIPTAVTAIVLDPRHQQNFTERWRR